MKIVAIVQARLNSTRLPNKVLLKIGKKSIIEIISDKLKKSKNIDNYLFCIPNDKSNDFLRKYLIRKKINFFLGKNENVLDRYYQSAKKFKADIVVRLTADNPLLDINLMDEMIREFRKSKIDFLDNNSPSTFPDGLDVEIFNFKSLEIAKKNARSKFDQEHVTTFIKKSKLIKRKNFYSKKDLSKFRFTLDEEQDYKNFMFAYEELKTKILDWKSLISLINKNKKYFNLFFSNKRNYGAFQNKGQKLWIKAKRLIGGGNSMISKNPELYPSNNWPVYFSKTKNCTIWDLDGRKYFDFTTMGVGTNILGYNNKQIDKEVSKVIKKGNISTLNSPEEVKLAEELLLIDKWAHKVCFARTGGEANAIAVRLARLASKKRTKILACGYHGWHDWYLASKNKEEINIKKNHLPFYSNKGIPEKLKGTIEFFEYNNIKDFVKKIKNDKSIGIVKMETMRFEFPKNNFLKKIQKIIKEKNLIFIIDECTTGFRENFGGLYSKYKLKPDLVIYGKSLGNGYAITAVLGNKKVMSNFDSSFISSTFWTERIGFAAGLATLKYMKKNQTWKKITKTGIYINNRWKMLAKKYKIKIKISGIPALSNFVFLGRYNNIYNSLIVEEMLKNNILATNTIYVSTSHTKKLLSKYFNVLESVFRLIKREKVENLKKKTDNQEYKRFRIIK